MHLIEEPSITHIYKHSNMSLKGFPTYALVSDSYLLPGLEWTILWQEWTERVWYFVELL